MAVTTTRTVNLKASYGDYTERTYKINWKGNVDIATKIKAFNAAAANDASSVAQTFLSENGAPIVAITDATTIVKTEEEIYHA